MFAVEPASRPDVDIAAGGLDRRGRRRADDRDACRPCIFEAMANGIRADKDHDVRLTQYRRIGFDIMCIARNDFDGRKPDRVAACSAYCCDEFAGLVLWSCDEHPDSGKARRGFGHVREFLRGLSFCRKRYRELVFMGNGAIAVQNNNKNETTI